MSISTASTDLRLAPLATEVSFWGRDGYQPSPSRREQVAAGLSALREESPDHARLLTVSAARLDREARWATDTVESERLRDAAVTMQRRALGARPAHGQGWRMLIQYSPAGPRGEATRREAFEQLQTLRAGR
ncbi:hypothetical protein E4634_12565 [Mangrovimicrobium sediminis]|uniref:Uncharacterized protein n=1 Tax=Mangrovimicrobium sediminis TaxID=2562682 RepID=A0A4Z0M0Z9_9GAMM|nr:hypothetical protein [Haliea sp. SAOS-164]TGD73107.1 hypothetical protein E4634_12565 [Haliea sp. SAOS-164]